MPLLIIKRVVLISYKSQRPFPKYELFLLLYVDDGALIFTIRSVTTLGSNLVFFTNEKNSPEYARRNWRQKV